MSIPPRSQAWLPVNSDTLMYGSSDATRNVYNKDSQLAEWVKQASEKLNLRTHKVKQKVRCGVVWYGMVWYSDVAQYGIAYDGMV